MNERNINVILYTRVSTDEQTDGCSIEMQERYLNAYCNNRGYNIISTYYEDYSAKHYDMRRPEIKKIYNYCKKHRNDVDKILFLRWDRYARNVEFAFAYKRMLYDELGIEINAIESPIDFEGTEWPLLLSMYCGTAHTEDVKISRRTKDGIRGHLLKGDCTHMAPRGYKNVSRGKHDCWVEIDEKWAGKVKEIFHEVALGIEKPNCIRERLCPKVRPSSFMKMLRNKFYIGLVHVPATKDEPAQDVKGKHEALIDEQTFYAVQEVIDGKSKKTPKLSKPANLNLYLRKFLVCPVCGHILTGATSHGNGGDYTYYFCSHDHKHINIRAEQVNEGFTDFVGTLKPHQAILALYNEVLLDIRGERVKANHNEADKLEEDLKKLQERINRVNDLYFDGEISKTEKEDNLNRYGKEAERLRDRIQTLRISEDLQVKDKLTYSINLIDNLGQFFRWAKPEVKIKLLGSMFPEKIEFDGKNYRTTSYNKMLDIIFKETKQLRGNAKVESPETTGNSTLVPPCGIEPQPSEPESEILSIKLRRQVSSCKDIVFS